MAWTKKRPASNTQCSIRPVSRDPCGAPEQRLYRHITWKSQGLQEGWIVQWKSRTIGGYHQRQQDAAKTLQDAMGLASMSQLPKVHPASSIQKISRYIGVYWHKRKKRYTTRDVCGSFHTAAVAAHARGAERKRVKPSVLMQRVKCIRQAMGQKHISLTKQTFT